MANTTVVKGGGGTTRLPGRNSREPRKQKGGKRARCAYCMGWVSLGEHRVITCGEQIRLVHRRHPRRHGEDPSPTT